MKRATILEMAHFRALPGVSDAQLQAAAAGVLPVLREVPGFVSYRQVRDEDGGWIDIVEWTDMAAFQAAEAVVHARAECPQWR